MSFCNMFRNYQVKSHIKIVLIGDGATGKTSYFDRISNGDDINYRFNRRYNASKGCSVSQLTFDIDDNEITVHLFDTAGQEKFGKLRDSYLIGADGVILMYDITNRDTKRNVLSKWIPDLKNILRNTKERNYVPVIVVGNKNDKAHINGDSTKDEFKIRNSTLNGAYSKYGKIDHINISVKANDNIVEPLRWLIKNILFIKGEVSIKR